MTIVEESGGADILTRTLVASDADTYSGALPGIQLDVTRTGVGFGPNVTAVWTDDGVSLASARVQFPVLGCTTTADDLVVAAIVTRAPPGTRWCESDIESGTVLVYGPGADHTAISPAGVEYSLVTVTLPVLEAAAADLRLPRPHIERGHVYVSAHLPRKHALAPLSDVFDGETPSAGSLMARREDALHVVLTALSVPDQARLGDSRRIDSRQVVAGCIEAFDVRDGDPSVRVMCRAANVSERRLREAFVDTFDLSPKRYWQLRRLGEARDELANSTARGATVQRVALDLGFGHMGRFARAYENRFGEKPSDTLATARCAGHHAECG